ncbi:signal protein PDZ [Occultella glacieicola]|uniref:endopeptidase La n=2 Tax=Occultella glacieicola TaxID=2518684 RepID=A0ABY2EBS8_9MICO|nr:signal protein PDZ [Occultella glacieicola]
MHPEPLQDPAPPSLGGRWRGLRRRLGLTTRSVTMTVSGVVAFGLLLTMILQPVPFAVQGAGPTFNTLGSVDDVPLITVEGAETYPTEGELRLTTVTTAGGPGFPVDVGSVIRGWLSAGRKVVPVETAVDPTLTQEEQDLIGAQQMSTSQENATVSALTALGYEVPATLTISGADPDRGAAGQVEEGDVITSIRTPDLPTTTITTYADLDAALTATPPNTTVTLGVDRVGVATDVEIVTSDDGAGGSLLGIYLSADFDFPVDVDIRIENVGGPSAGTMFALGIIDQMTPGALTGGEIVAGTGTMSLAGEVGPIGGITLKMYAAERDGADFFLAPAANCAEVVGNVPDGLEVFRVATLTEAETAVEAIAAGDTADLPVCTAD